LEFVKDWQPVAVVLGVLEFAGVLVVTPLAVWDTDTPLVLELVALADSFGVVDEKGDWETEGLALVDSDSAGLVEAIAVPERLGVVEGLCVTEADPESL